MFLAAVDALHGSRREPAINVKVVLDPEEESGGARGFRSFLGARTSLFASDGLVVFDGPQGEDNRPLLAFGFRGGVTVQVTVFGPRDEANYAPNPLQKLARLVGNLKDEDGRVTIPGYYDAVKLDEETRQLLAAVPTSEEPALNARLGIARREQIGANFREALMYPTLTRMAGGALDKSGKVVPEAGAVPTTSPAACRAMQSGRCSPTSRRSRSAVGPAFERVPAARSGRGRVRRRSERHPMLGDSLPVDTAIETLGVPFAIAPLANGDGQSAHRERKSPRRSLLRRRQEHSLPAVGAVRVTRAHVFLDPAGPGGHEHTERDNLREPGADGHHYIHALLGPSAVRLRTRRAVARRSIDENAVGGIT
jgi:hypothetical protein